MKMFYHFNTDIIFFYPVLFVDFILVDCFFVKNVGNIFKL
ncbi:hypothetical protein P296_21945 [Salmonella enterica subsp. arizonae serovar 18:z4,z23:- str. CVM N26624]|uniref:Uncharacterized protein n=1 Tax=Salmonella enterica subsp. arizonae serovar 18:z4,z23:- str. CVM N26626 TaxID=1395119 RepID=A0A3S5YEC4_SALER|nr:hypothetical protein N898_03000 [Salmonella enterica subsp. arizonae serovar 62:z36:- str. RKS2983]OLV93176.1 hypothetical protein P298_22515 [Salmonella enterica subsp. arizonae serovar 18:z4,z23:- str. CVM N26626]OLV93189.1 hypothetical protein P296_21945 [Salmonella enterica subsp. arizonae serovar 18:z4,z23:- str. CVM N26624]OLV93229.1 hypothetical protein P297_22335 [Salmonella enterica subsp. arizonae serovar 18:z4,z23:- str. CVM N26625]OLW05258.1 hypothetical protein P295_21605 [Salmo